MQPVKKETLNLTAILRQAAVDFMNLELESRYPVHFEYDENASRCILQGDKELLLRAVYNVLSNSQLHNPQGCNISMELQVGAQTARIYLEDDGIGISEEQLKTLTDTPHYMMGSGSGLQRYGLGLLIVRQIAAAHGGQVRIGHGRSGVFLLRLIFRFKSCWSFLLRLIFCLKSPWRMQFLFPVIAGGILTDYKVCHSVDLEPLL